MSRSSPFRPWPRLAFGVVAFLLLASFLALSPTLRATGPLFQVKKTIRATDLDPAATSDPMTLSGLATSGSLSGYFTVGTRLYGQNYLLPHAFFWDADTAVPTDLCGAMGAQTSIATCLSPAGVVGGVGWTSGNLSNQFGFTWDHGTAHAFQSPSGGDIDAVVAVNDLGQAIATYYGDYGYKRAFLWNGTVSTDLGDLGDPENSFVWPQAINNAGQIVGTVYDFGAVGGVVTPSAFLYQSTTMGYLDENGDYPASYGLGINSFGEVAGSFQYQSSVNPMTQVTGGFYWLDDVLTELGALTTNKSVFPFAINEAGQVIGTAYAANILHLFKWQANQLNDLGTVTLNAGDTMFQLTGINSGVNIVGFVTDLNNQPQAVWRMVNEPAGTMHNVAAMLPTSVGFVADNTAGTSVLVNEQGRVACSGYVQGQPVVLLLLPDSDGDGMPDEWETAHGLNPFDDSDANLDFDGDGLTNLQEYQQGSDPRDFFNGVAPQLSIVKGSPQSGLAGSVLGSGLYVRVTGPGNQPIYHAPVSFVVSSGSGSFKTTLTSTPTATVTVTTSSGGDAHVYFVMPTSASPADIQITATTGGALPVVFHATLTAGPGNGGGTGGNSSGAFAPENVVATLNDDGSLDISWTSNEDDDSGQSIPIRVTMPDGTLALEATVPADQNSVHIDAPAQ